MDIGGVTAQVLLLRAGQRSDAVPGAGPCLTCAPTICVLQAEGRSVGLQLLESRDLWSRSTRQTTAPATK
jgi:hypothetical protein